MSPFTPSPEQESIYSSMLSSNLIVSACPGSGKTTTILQGFSRIPRSSTSIIPPRILYLVFNKRNQLEAVEKVKTLGIRDVEISTFHSLGMRALKSSGLFDQKSQRSKDFVNSRKVPRLVWNAMDRNDPDVQGVIKLVGLFKSVASHEADSQTALTLCDHYEVDIENKSRDIALRVLERSNADMSCIDFDDMLYLPVLHGITFQPWDWVFTDECQDTNEVQGEILWRLNRDPNHFSDGSQIFPQRPSTRYVFVGDPHQAIYGFRGASSDAMTKLRERFQCISLPLSVSYRCPKAVVKEAQKFI